MAVISAFTLIRAVSLFHLTAAYFFLTAPWLMADQNIVFILGQSQKLVSTTPPQSTRPHEADPSGAPASRTPTWTRAASHPPSSPCC